MRDIYDEGNSIRFIYYTATSLRNVLRNIGTFRVPMYSIS